MFRSLSGLSALPRWCVAAPVAALARDSPWRRFSERATSGRHVFLVVLGEHLVGDEHAGGCRRPCATTPGAFAEQVRQHAGVSHRHVVPEVRDHEAHLEAARARARRCPASPCRRAGSACPAATSPCGDLRRIEEEHHVAGETRAAPARRRCSRRPRCRAPAPGDVCARRHDGLSARAEAAARLPRARARARGAPSTMFSDDDDEGNRVRRPHVMPHSRPCRGTRSCASASRIQLAVRSRRRISARSRTSSTAHEEQREAEQHHQQRHQHRGGHGRLGRAACTEGAWCSEFHQSTE